MFRIAEREEIILFGGLIEDNYPANPKLAILTAKWGKFKWSIPSASDSSPTIFGHSANFCYHYMLIAFGKKFTIKFFSLNIRMRTIINYFRVLRI